MKETQDIHELPTRRFFISFLFMMPRLTETARGNDFSNKMFDSINSYHEESLALLRSTEKLYRTVTKDEEEFEKGYVEKRNKIEKLSEEDKEWADVLTSRILEEMRNFYDLLDIEKNLFSVGMIVQFLSSLESTLHSLYQCLISIDNHLLKIEDVCKRDKGIIRYIKYFEKTLITSTIPPILIGTPHYEKLHQWIDFRNNIVHNNNESTDRLKEVIKLRKLKVNDQRSKFIFNKDNIRDLANICGHTLDILIEEIFKPYFIDSGALVD
ncbi:hypothetical protein [Peribacillus sp. SCS-155]|uniref:hypothetical protein n=1 Tax=Peribacillus sedimenti TaxID=3115297 RepID=UPI003905ED89